MKGIMFLDKDFKPIKLPKVDDVSWIEFIDKARYAFFNIPERMKWFKETYQKLDEMNSIFAKTGDGVYTYSEEDDYWFKETEKFITHHVVGIYNEISFKEEV